VIVEHTDSVGDAMARMTLTARQVIRSLSESDLPAAQEALADVEATSRSFLTALARASCPEYLKGADAQIHDALKLLIDAGQRGAAAVQAMDGRRLESIAGEMDAAADDIGVAAQRITDWRSGAARP
jgi:signal transduction histidine kinase